MDQNAKQLIAEKLRNSGSVLVTVSKDPSVDQLASAIGLNLMLDALGKHATSVFSGQIPDTMQFLDAKKHFDPNVDGLRDFIISLSKDKAEKLRYKVEDEIVRIFITPYQGQITKDDLEFSQGDFNVDVVVALGVKKRNDLDNAITAHGRILHDATIVTITAGEGQESNLGAVNWHDPQASSVAEMLVSISEALQNNILDAAMATAFLTGIVASTERFSNQHTTPKVMTMAAQLMAAGANQQLIATNLQLEKVPSSVPTPPASPADEGVVNENQTVDLSHVEKTPQAEGTAKTDEQPQTQGTALSLKQIEQELKAQGAIAADQPAPQQTMQIPSDQTTPGNIHPPKIDDSTTDVSQTAQQAPASIHPTPSHEANRTFLEKPAGETDIEMMGLEKSPEDSEDGRPNDEAVALAHKPDQIIEPPSEKPQGIADVKGQGPRDVAPTHPSLGGTFNATSEEALESAEREKQNPVNSSILSHGNHANDESTDEDQSAPPENDIKDDQPTPSIPAMPSPQSDEMIEQARQAVEEASNASYDVANDPKLSTGASYMPEEEISEEIQIDTDGRIHSAPDEPPSSGSAPQAPPPLPPRP